jgi:hypothetical protein
MPAAAVADAVWAGHWVASLAPAGFPVGRFRADLLRWLELLSSCLDQAAEHRVQQPQASFVDALDESGKGDQALRAIQQVLSGFAGLQTELLEMEARTGVSGRDVMWIELEPQATAAINEIPDIPAIPHSVPHLTNRQQKVAFTVAKVLANLSIEEWASLSGESKRVVWRTFAALQRVGWAVKENGHYALTEAARKYLRPNPPPETDPVRTGVKPAQVKPR